MEEAKNQPTTIEPTLSYIRDPKTNEDIYTLRVPCHALISLQLTKADRNYHRFLEQRGRMSDTLFYLADVMSLLEDKEDDEPADDD